MIDIDKYDSILYIDDIQNINEDERIHTKRQASSIYGGDNINRPESYLLNAFAYGKIIQQAFSSERGVFCEVADFGKYVSVTAGVSDPNTGRTSKKTFLIVFKSKEEGLVYSASNKWRSVSGVQQAISYIKSVVSVLRNDTNKRL